MIFLKKKENKKRGFVILFAILISAIVLAIVIGISSIAYKEVLLSSFAKEGNVAFYAADTGIECALYLDSKNIFSEKSGPEIIAKPKCGDEEIIINSSDMVSDFQFNTSSGGCAKINVDKDYLGQGATKIESLGYNLSCDEIGVVNNSRLVQRAIGIVYGEVPVAKEGGMKL